MTLVEEKSTHVDDDLEEGELRDTEDENDSGILFDEIIPEDTENNLVVERMHPKKRRCWNDEQTNATPTIDRSCDELPPKRLRRSSMADYRTATTTIWEPRSLKTLKRRTQHGAHHSGRPPTTRRHRNTFSKKFFDTHEHARNAFTRLTCHSCKDRTSNLRENPVITASRNGHSQCVKVLASNGAHLRDRNRKMESAFSFAVHGNFYDVVDELLPWIKRPSSHESKLNYRKFIDRAEDIHSSLLTKLWKNKFIHTDKDLSSLVMFFLRHGFKCSAEEVLSEITNEEHVKRYCAEGLYYCVKYEFIGILRLLLKKTVDVNSFKDHKTALFYACENGKNEIVKLLLEEYDAEPNEYEQIPPELGDDERCMLPIQIAVSTGNAKAVDLLLDYEAIVDMWSGNKKVNEALKRGELPFYLAYMGGHMEIAKVLLRKRLGSNYDTVLHRSARAACYEEIPMLILMGSKINQTNRLKETALHLVFRPFSEASTSEEKELWNKKVEKSVALLLREGANPNARCNAGETPLYRAVEKGCVGAVKLLLPLSVRQTLDDCNNEKNPRNAATKTGNKEILQMLLDYMDDRRVSCSVEESCTVSNDLVSASHLAGNSADQMDTANDNETQVVMMLKKLRSEAAAAVPPL